MRLAKVWPDGPLVLGRDKQIAEWVQRRIPNSSFGDKPAAIGIIRKNALVGGIVFHDYQPAFQNISVSLAFDTPRAISNDVLCSVAAYVFKQQDCVRLNALVARKNKRSRKWVEGVGFKLEGCARKGYGKDDLMIYGMLRHECRWLIKDKNE
jgi:RimJ/RimL family protein N-acetyltransferase